MKKLFVLFIMALVSLSLYGCEDRKIIDDEFLVVFYTNTYIRRQTSGGVVSEPTYATFIAPITVATDNVLEPVDDPVRPGYTFGGWYDARVSENIHGEVPEDVALPWDWNREIQRSLTLYARWIPNQNTITYMIDEATTNHSDNPDFYRTRQSPAVNFRTPTRPDSTFLGWYFVPLDENFDPNLHEPLPNTRVCPIDNDEEEAPYYCHKPLTLYAHFSVRQFTIRFDTVLEFMTTLQSPMLTRIDTYSNMTLDVPRLRTTREVALSYEDYVFLGHWDVQRMRQFIGAIPDPENPDNDPIFAGDIYDLERNATFFGRWAQPTIPDEDVDGDDFTEVPRYVGAIRSDYVTQTNRTRVEYRVDADWSTVIDFYTDHLNDNDFDDIRVLPVYPHMTVLRAVDENGKPFEITIADLNEGVINIIIVKTHTAD